MLAFSLDPGVTASPHLEKYGHHETCTRLLANNMATMKPVLDTVNMTIMKPVPGTQSTWLPWNLYPAPSQHGYHETCTQHSSLHSYHETCTRHLVNIATMKPVPGTQSKWLPWSLYLALSQQHGYHETCTRHSVNMTIMKPVPSTQSTWLPFSKIFFIFMKPVCT